MDLPHLTRALSTGDISLDKMRAVVGLATPETDRELAACAGDRTVAELGELAGSLRHSTRMVRRQAGASRRLGTLQRGLPHVVRAVPGGEFAEVRAAVEAQAKALPSDGETPLGSSPVRRLLGTVQVRGLGPVSVC